MSDAKHATILGGLAIIALFLIGSFSGNGTASFTQETGVVGNHLAAIQAQNEQQLTANPHDERALFTLARVYYISGQTDRALAAIETYKELYPEEKRIHYVAGLTQAYAGNLRDAEEEFHTFIDSGLSTWPGYLDLAWVYFRQGEFDEAEDALSTAVEEYGDNAWLNTSLGAVALAQGENEEAILHLEKAEQQAAVLTKEEWQENYSLNDPANFENEIAQLQAVVASNLAHARGTDARPHMADALRAAFAGASPLGVSRGVAVSACGNSCTTTACVSAANICGQVSTGTQSSCGAGGCSAGTPPDPVGTCTFATQCGNAQGFVGCNGGCNITSYPVCLSTSNPDGIGDVTWITLGDGPGDTLGATDVSAQISVIPALVNPGGRTVVAWVSTETTECTITGENGDEWGEATIGQELSGFITQETDYTLVCEGYDGSTVTDTATVRIVPIWQEF